MKKKLIIDSNIIKDLEFSEVLEMYDPLIKNIIFKFSNLKMEYDDKYQFASMAIWKAYKFYNIETTVSFSNLAKKYIDNEFVYHVNYNNRIKRSGYELLSMDKADIKEKGQENSILDTLKSNVNVENDIILKNSLSNFINMITDQQKNTIALFMAGNKYNEISKILGTSSSTISMRMTKIKKIYHTCMAF